MANLYYNTGDEKARQVWTDPTYQSHDQTGDRFVGGHTHNEHIIFMNAHSSFGDLGERLWAVVHEMGHAFGLPHSGGDKNSPAHTPPGGIVDAVHDIADTGSTKVQPADANAILRNAFERPLNPRDVHVQFSGAFTPGTWFDSLDALETATVKALMPPPMPQMLPSTRSAPVTGTSTKP
jgi:hypothetical protein